MKDHKESDKMGNLVSAQELAGRLGISLRTLEKLIVQNKVPAYIKLGRLRRWRPEQVDAWINEQFARASGEKAAEHQDEISPTA